MSSDIPFKLSIDACKRLYYDNSQAKLSISSKVYPIMTKIAEEYVITLTDIAIGTALDQNKTTLQKCHLP